MLNQTTYNLNTDNDILNDNIVENFKICTVCNMNKSFNDYQVCKRSKFGLKARCKDCGNIYNRKYNQNPCVKEKNRVYYIKRRDEKPEEIKKAKKKHYAKYSDIYSKKNKEKYNSDNSYRLKITEYAKIWRTKSESIPLIKNQNKRYVEKMPDDYIKRILGFKKTDDLPKEIIETKRLIIKLKRTLKDK